MRKLKSIQQFNEENCLSKEQLEQLQGGANGMDVNLNPKTDDVQYHQTGPYYNDCDCMGWKDGQMFGGEFATQMGETICE